MEQLQAGIRLWPGNGAARLLAGRAAERLGHFDQAILEYRNAVRSDVEGTSAVFELAGLHEAEGIYPAAYFPLNVRLQRKPGDVRAGLDLVRIALAGRNVPLASTTATSLGANGEAVAELLARAMIAEATEGPDAAAETLIASDLDWRQPADFEVLEALVGYLVEAGRETEAVSRAQEAAEQNPTSPALHSLHASALRAKGRGTSAREAYRRSLALDPENAQALAGLALLEAEAGDHAGAKRLYDRSAVADPDDPAAAWAAILLAVDTESESAVDARLEALLYKHPRHAQAATLLASRLFERGTDLARADELSRRAIRFRGGAQAFETGGRIALSQGDSARALRLLRRALELRPDSPGTRYQLALALIEADKPDAARKALEAALATGEFDQSAQAREALTRLTLDTGASDE
jgi:Flp pilus assembly protein TadD